MSCEPVLPAFGVLGVLRGQEPPLDRTRLFRPVQNPPREGIWSYHFGSSSSTFGATRIAARSGGGGPEANRGPRRGKSAHDRLRLPQVGEVARCSPAAPRGSATACNGIRSSTHRRSEAETRTPQALCPGKGQSEPGRRSRRNRASAAKMIRETRGKRDIPRACGELKRRA